MPMDELKIGSLNEPVPACNSQSRYNTLAISSVIFRLHLNETLRKKH